MKDREVNESPIYQLSNSRNFNGGDYAAGSSSSGPDLDSTNTPKMNSADILVNMKLGLSLSPVSSTANEICDSEKSPPNTSRYGRARKQKIYDDYFSTNVSFNSAVKSISPKKLSPQLASTCGLLNQASLNPSCSSTMQTQNGVSNDSNEFIDQTPIMAQTHKVYVRKDLLQKPRIGSENTSHIRNIFSPTKSPRNIVSSVVLSTTYSGDYTQEFDKKHSPAKMNGSSADGTCKQNEKSMFIANIMEETCPWTVGDIVWARLGRHPFWPCMITREPVTNIFVRKKRAYPVALDVIHVTFFSDYSRRSWVFSTMIKKFTTVDDFQAERNAITPEMRKKHPKYYTAFSIPSRLLPKWQLAVKEAKMILKRPIHLRPEFFSELSNEAGDADNVRRHSVPRKREKSQNSNDSNPNDVSASESLFESLFSSDIELLNASNDISLSSVSTTVEKKLKKQSHMERWLLKAKTPHKKSDGISNSDNTIFLNPALNNNMLQSNSQLDDHISKKDENSDHTHSSCTVKIAERKIEEAINNGCLTDSNDSLKTGKIPMAFQNGFVNSVETGGLSQKSGDTGAMESGSLITEDSSNFVIESKIKSDFEENEDLEKGINEEVSDQSHNISTVEIGETKIEKASINKYLTDISGSVETRKIHNTLQNGYINTFETGGLSIKSDDTEIKQNDNGITEYSSNSIITSKSKSDFEPGESLELGNNKEVSDHSHNSSTIEIGETEIEKASINKYLTNNSESVQAGKIPKTLQNGYVNTFETGGLLLESNDTGVKKNESVITEDSYNSVVTSKLKSAIESNECLKKSNNERVSVQSVELESTFQRDENGAPREAQNHEVITVIKDERDDTLNAYEESHGNLTTERKSLHRHCNNKLRTNNKQFEKKNLEEAPKKYHSDKLKNKKHVEALASSVDDVLPPARRSLRGNHSSAQIDAFESNKQEDGISSNIEDDKDTNSNFEMDEMGGDKIHTRKLLRSDCSSVKGNTENKHISSSPMSTVVNNQMPEVEFKMSNSQLLKLPAQKNNNINKNKYDLNNPSFLYYLNRHIDFVIDENPTWSDDEAQVYLYHVWKYEETVKNEMSKHEEEKRNNLMIAGVESAENDIVQRLKRKRKTDPKDFDGYKSDIPPSPRSKPKRANSIKKYNDDDSNSSDNDEAAFLDVIKVEPDTVLTEADESENVGIDSMTIGGQKELSLMDKYLEDLLKTHPSIYKGLPKEKVCEHCGQPSNLIKCKGPCSGMYHMDCMKLSLVLPALNSVKQPSLKKHIRKSKISNAASPLQKTDKLCNGDVKISDQNNTKDETELLGIITANALDFEEQLAEKMKLLMEESQQSYPDGVEITQESMWDDAQIGKCEIVDYKPPTNDDEIQPGQSRIESEDKCWQCQTYDTPLCFVCHSDASPKDSTHRQRCSIPYCNKYYHLECLDIWPQTKFNTTGPSKNQKGTKHLTDSITCPRHVCHTCVSDDPRGNEGRFSADKLVKCIRCPATYHMMDKCTPAGTNPITSMYIVCPRHIDRPTNRTPQHVNTAWCFLCAKGGTLICCDTCPTSFHAECLNISPPDGGYICEDCETGRLPLLGELVWAKLGQYRWWPGYVLHPAAIPEKIRAIPHQSNEFVVRFFGQHDHYWLNRGRVFLYQAGDTGYCSNKKTVINIGFMKAIEEAQKASVIVEGLRSKQNHQDVSQMPPRFIKLKVNRPVGNLATVPLRPAPSCDCKPHMKEPCGINSDCLNRMLLTECSPQTCPAETKCLNRQFEQRTYPNVGPSRTSQRGWGLVTNEDIGKGQFVIEYVGEVIDETEFKRRMVRKHETKDENYYFLTLDKDRMIDAGPKGNYARFMNHSCEPNCETQKWTVNGDTRVGLFALHDIPAGSELTFNYKFDVSDGTGGRQLCFCGAVRCGGFIGAKLKQDESQPKKTLSKKKTLKRKYTKTAERWLKQSKPTAEKSNTPKAAKAKPAKVCAAPALPSYVVDDLLLIHGTSADLDSADTLDGDASTLAQKECISDKKNRQEMNGLSSPEALRTNAC